jgi:hypothetical protein
MEAIYDAASYALALQNVEPLFFINSAPNFVAFSALCSLTHVRNSLRTVYAFLLASKVPETIQSHLL